MKTAICVIIKDENEYLDEWLTHHLNLGIDEIFLYEDNGSKSHSDIIKPYGNRVHLIPIDDIYKNNPKPEHSRNQINLFNWFPMEFKNKFDWVLFIDLDEFLILKQPLHDLLKEYDDKPGILIQWKWFGASGHIFKPVGKVMDNFTKQTTTTFDYYWSYKSFINCKLFKKWKKDIHEVEGGVFPLTKWGGHKAHINHYFTKSWEEWKTKILDRGDAMPGHRKIDEFFLLNPDLNDIKDKLISEIIK